MASPLSRALLTCLLAMCAALSGEEKPLVRLRGSDFAGGAAGRFGGTFYGVSGVNYVYAESNGPLASMRATFQLDAAPGKPAFLHLRARDDDAAAACPIEIALNGKPLARGPSEFPSDAWQWAAYPIPAGALKAGPNELAVFNHAPKGAAGMPPWFMVAECCIAGEDYVPAAAASEDLLTVTLPIEKRPLPEDLPPGHTEPAFKVRGMKGWNWIPEQYLAEIPVLAACKMNFLMNCYLSMFTPGGNRWWEPLPDAKKKAYEEVVRACQKHGIEFCFATNPNLSSSRPLDYQSAKDLDALWAHYEWMAGLGVNWFSICLDDISKGIDAAGQAKAVNEILRRLRARNPKAQMVFCPTYYWGTGDDRAARAYLETLASDLHEDVYVFWTGPGVVTPAITRAAAQAYRDRVKHRLIVWDNYPVNDAQPTLHLGPVSGRDPDLFEAADGYMANPLCPQNEANRIPLLTIADYAYNPWGYDPARSIGQAIAHLAETSEQRAVLKDLVELYPGMLLAKQGTGWNPVLSRFREVAHSQQAADACLQRVQGVADRMGKAFPDRFKAAQRTLAANLATMRAELARKHPPPSPAP
ncbi:MAG: hypothetical protein FJ290_09980 [Planctomycetes bacterium]|nr:hypothetical protein [Planctomycetota bacterium]